MPFHSSHRPQKVLLAQFSPYVHKGRPKPHSFIFLISLSFISCLSQPLSLSIFTHCVCPPSAKRGTSSTRIKGAVPTPRLHDDYTAPSDPGLSKRVIFEKNSVVINVGLMLGQRRRRRPNIKPALA